MKAAAGICGELASGIRRGRTLSSANAMAGIIESGGGSVLETT